MQRNRTLVRMYLLSSSVLPLPGSWSRDDFRRPPLSSSTHGRTTTVPLSISEPCLFTPGQRAVFEGFSKNRRPLLHKRGPSSPSCKTLENTKAPQQSYHQVYMHFSRPLKPVPKVGQAFTHSQRRATESTGLQALVRQHLETLSVRGQTFLPTQHLPTSSSSAPRTQLHVFLPAEGARQEEDGDSESVDEGFMDELDNKVTTLRLQDPKIPKQIEKSLTGQMVQ
ncbi:uncharacterized protein LOC107670263 [Sinocyclocheilus anshuiensis]|uniref:uncharacterized protein LOC107670263 n=1 Tax=Sinocyclocheilus anshuiensis TaxID=1608454 RepID=UPI0007B9B815|nr:PREDICTED: uncharacterized protein LOC107670263 [Sinocyclocheilus anshuiensis]